MNFIFQRYNGAKYCLEFTQFPVKILITILC